MSWRNIALGIGVVTMIAYWVFLISTQFDTEEKCRRGGWDTYFMDCRN